MKTPNLNDHYLAPSMNNDRQGPPSIASTLRDLPKAKTPSVPDLSRPPRPPQPQPIPLPIPTSTPTSFIPSAPASLNQEDIRLCTINRADPQDTFGIELNYHKKEQFHSLSVTPGRENGPSSKTPDLPRAFPLTPLARASKTPSFFRRSFSCFRRFEYDCVLPLI